MAGPDCTLKKIIGFFLLFFVLWKGNAQSFSYEEKKNLVLNDYKLRPYSRNWNVALAKIHMQYDTAVAYRIIDSLTLKPFGDMFWMYPAIALYLHEKDRLPDNYRQKIRNAFRTYTPGRGNTENHWLMYYGTLYLASQCWSGEAGTTWFNGKSSKENFQESEEYIHHWISEITSIGQGEYDSPVYGTYYIGPLLLLHQFSNDPQMRKRTEKVLHWILADYIIDYSGGVFAGGYSRLYEYDIFSKRNTNMSALIDFFLGDTTIQFSKPNILIAALGNYRLPDILVKIAGHRKMPYTNMERKRCAPRIRYYDTKDPIVTRYNFISPSYSLGALFEKPFGIQQHSWHLTWKASRQQELTSFFGLHPYYSAHHLCAGLTSLKKFAVEDVIHNKTFYNKEDKWIGASPYEQLFQHKNILIALYDLRAEDAVFKHYDIFFPKDLTAIEEDSSGWIFAHAPNIYIALKPFCPYAWIQEAHGKRLRSTALLNGYVLITGDPQELHSLGDFKKLILEKTKANFDPRENAMDIKTYDQRRIRFSYSGERMVNGKKTGINDFPLFKSPFVNAKEGSRRMVLRHERKRLVVDLNDHPKKLKK
jgi:hypothetical protein